jgi:hypothetical protein
VIRIDHQVAVLGHFYEGRKVRELVRSFLDWQVELNLETAAFFRELVEACDGAAGAEDPALLRAVDSIARRELPAREARLRRLCDFRGALDRFANASVASGRRVAVAPPASRLRMPRHAAAVAAAIGLFGCAVAHDRGIQEAPPPPIDPRPPPVPPPPPEAQQPKPKQPPPPPQSPWVPVPVEPEPDHVRDEGVAEAAPPPYDDEVKPPFLIDHGVAEAAPPPYDEETRVKPPPPPPPPPFNRTKEKYRMDHGVAEAAPPPYDRRRVPIEEPVKPPPFLHDHGVAEAAPPPYDRYRHDNGVAEAAPPPYEDRGPVRIHSLQLQTSPAVPLYVDGQRVEPPFQLPMNGKPMVIGDSSVWPYSVRLRAVERPKNALLLILDSDQPLLVKGDGKVSGPPWRVVLPAIERPFKVVLQNPATGATLVLRLLGRP